MKGNPSAAGTSRKNEAGANVPRGENWGNSERGQIASKPANLGVKGWSKGTGGSLYK